MVDPKRSDSVDIELLFRSHLKEYHGIETEKAFSQEFVKEHLTGQHTLLPISIFSNTPLSALEVIVKYLRENEGLKNKKVAEILGRNPQSIWITYRNATKKYSEKIIVSKTEKYVSTEILIESKLSVLEGISFHLQKEYGMNYAEIGRILNRDERTIWTVIHRARGKIAQ